MSELAGAENVIPPVEPGTGNEPQGDNPAWNDFLRDVPPGMHDMFRPYLAKWDQGVNARIQQVHSEYADWKPLRDQGVTAEQIQQGISIFNAIETDPRRVYDILGQTYGYATANQMVQNAGQGQPNPQMQPEPTAEYQQFGQQAQQPNPEVAQLRATVDTMANIMLAQRNAEVERQQDALLDKELSDLRGKIGDFGGRGSTGEQFILGMMNAGLSADQAGQAYLQFRSETIAQTNRPAAPTVINGAGPLPSNAIDPTKLDAAGRKNLVAEMMRATNRQG